MRNSRRVLSVLPVAACIWQALPCAYAGENRSGPRTASEKEIARREGLIGEAQTLMHEADQHLARGNYEESMRLYRQAWEMIPNSPTSSELKKQARDGCSRATIGQARKLAASGRYAEARTLTQSVLAPNFDPENQEALAFQAELEDPARYESALTPEHSANVEKVTILLREATSLQMLGDYDGAITRYQDILRIDRYNSAARRGMEQTEQRKSNHYSSARDHTRAKALAAVDQTWESSVPVMDVSNLFGGMGGAITSGKDAVSDKLHKIVLPRVDLQGASLEEVVEFLRIRSRELDPDKRGVDFVLKIPAELRNLSVTLNLADVPLEEVLRYATEHTGTVYRTDEYAVTITSHTEQSTTLVSRTYRVPPDFIQNAPMGEADPAGGAGIDPFAKSGTDLSQGLQIRRVGAREFLEQRGVAFPEGATANYNPSTNILLVRNTVQNLTLTDALVELAQNSTPKQVEIQVKMIEVNQTRLEELGFDWLLSAFNVPGSSRLFGSGGTGTLAGTDVAATWADGSPIGTNPITSGLRSSGAINGVQTIDSLIGRTTVSALNARSPGTFAVTGVFTDPQFQLVIRALNQNKGIDLLASPSIVTKSGQRANITVSREFRYPTEFDPPQIPQTLSTVIPGGNVDTIYGTSDFAPITPSTPTSFEKRDVGIVLDVEPVISSDNNTVEVSLTPNSTEFEGFIDYGEDINNTVPGPFNTRISFPVQNDILQPIFRTNKINTAVTVWDGNTIVLGGVIEEKITDIKDKVPLLGDIPLIGRTFQSKVTKTEKKNVIFFVTVKVIDPSGNRVNQTTSTVAR